MTRDPFSPVAAGEDDRSGVSGVPRALGGGGCRCDQARGVSALVGLLLMLAERQTEEFHVGAAPGEARTEVGLARAGTQTRPDHEELCVARQQGALGEVRCHVFPPTLERDQA